MLPLVKDSHSEMTSYQRIMTALEGGTPDRVPVIAIVRDWTAKQAGFTITEIMENVEKYVFSQYYCARSFGYDSVFDLAAIHAESEAMGCKLDYSDSKAPAVKENVIKDYKTDLSKLKLIDPNKDGRLPLILEGIRRLKSLCENNIPIIAYLQAPFRQAAMLRGNDIYKDLLKKKNGVKELLEITFLSQLIYGVALVNAGADILLVSDPTSSGDVISRDQWIEFGYIYTKRLINELKKSKIKIFLHICGDTSDRLDTFGELGIDGMSLDQKVDLEYARKVLGEKICIIGNVSPIHLSYNTPDEIREESKICIEKAGKNGSYILCSGCGVGSDAPPENIQAMIEVAKNYNY